LDYCLIAKYKITALIEPFYNLNSPCIAELYYVITMNQVFVAIFIF